MYTKSENHLYRISTNLFIIKQALEILSSLKVTKEVDGKKFYEIVKTHSWKTIIDCDTVVLAKHAMRYFIEQKFYLTGYEKNDEDEFIFKSLNLKKSTLIKNSVKNSLTNNVSTEDNLLKLILQSPGEIVFLDDLNHSYKNINATTFDETGQKLGKLNFGELGNFKEPGAHKGKKGFKKVNFEMLENEDTQLSFINNLMSLSVNLEDYKEAFLKAKPSKSEKKASKRKIGPSGDTSGSTAKTSKNINDSEEE